MSKNTGQILVGIVMGSQSDWPTMKESNFLLNKLEIGNECKIISAHRTPNRMSEYANSASNRGIKIIIAGAGGAAHLPGMLSSHCNLPVIGVPINSSSLKGMDSLLSIVQMPQGIPVATMAIGEAGAKNAAIFAAEILSLSNEVIKKNLSKWRKNMAENVPFEPK